MNGRNQILLLRLAAPILSVDVAARAGVGRADLARRRDFALRAAADIGVHA